MRDSPIIAQLRTNVIMKDEYPLIMDLSQTLAHRYQRPDSSVMVILEHSACLLLGGTFDPTYLLTVTALPVHIQPSTNKRNAALLQSFLSDTLGVPPHRGIVKFQSILEENLAMNGTTILGEIERLEKQLAEENGSALKRTMTKASRKSLVLKPRPSLPTMGSSPTVVNGHSPSYPPVLTPVPIEAGDVDGPPSFLSDSNHLSELSSPLNRKTSRLPIKTNIPSPQAEDTSSKHDRARRRTAEARPAGKTAALPKMPLPPPIPAEATPKIGKRKSLIAIFKR
ncbi:Tautomerase/MIF [Mytilinidion resinicola]|uniref:L-dopachrome isomerase n=1 Tax=Mytilinidion resinicola TaxID=574789 RepID=A0A6A6Z6X8_9PEZI|nr:Tautomerase/MIF [Mytilinidion resinicola]KAF2816037.1 Tautomerase/MIF [Mytilinidion resinicola]